MVAELLLVLVLASAAGGATYVIKYHKRERLLLENQKRERLALFRDALIREMRGRPLSEFSYSEFIARCEVPREHADKVAADIYRQLCRNVWADGVVTNDERTKLKTLSSALELGSGTVSDIEGAAAANVYREAVADVVADGIVTQAESARLDSLRRSLGLGRQESLQIAGDISCEAYISVLRRIVRGGQVTAHAKEELHRLKHALAISDVAASDMVRDEAVALYRECFTIAAQDGIFTAAEKDTLRWLQVESGLGDSQIAPYTAMIKKIERLAEYRDGRLPSLTTRKLLESGEICHWEGACQLRYQTPKSQQQVGGELMVTSKQVIFSSPTKSLSFSPSKIVDIDRHGHVVDLTVSSRQGAGAYHVTDAEELEAILVGVVRKHKYLLSQRFASTMSRHIPDDVKRSVYYRDGGRCAKCTATDYLEYDHIIPHTRGGASTVGNVQLLCRRCNLEKSDRI